MRFGGLHQLHAGCVLGKRAQEAGEVDESARRVFTCFAARARRRPQPRFGAAGQ
jgi:hypothetical protein